MKDRNKASKVVHILNEICFSGAETMLKDAGPLFCNYGFKFYALSTGSYVGDYAAILEKSGFEIRHIPFKKSPIFFMKLFFFLKKEKIDVVHIHTERAFFWYVLTAKISGIRRIVRTVHNVFTYKGFILRNTRRFQRFFSNKILRVKFLSIGNSVEEVERRNFKNKTIVVRNWVNQNEFYPQINSDEKRSLRLKFGLNPDAFILISVGACTPTKNHSDVIKALSFIYDKSFLERLVYLHVGDGDLCDKEQDLAENLGFENNIMFYGKTDQVRHLLVASDVFVMTSHYEGLPIALLEAMSCELPAVAYDVPGIKDLVVNGVNGLLIKPNPKNLAEAITDIAQTKEIRELYGSRARQFAEKNYNMRNSVTQMIKQYGYEIGATQLTTS